MRIEAPGDRPTRRCLVLVVDDDPDTRFIFPAALEHAGYEARVEADGAAALAAIRSDPPDIVVLDLAMPRLSGLEVLARMKEDPRTRAIPVIACTAVATQADVPDLRSHGFSDILLKPVDPSAVIASVARLSLDALGGRPNPD